MKLLEIVRQHIPSLLKKAYFCKDGCTAQFRFRFTFHSMTFYPNDLELSWDYGGAHHFKGSYDGIGLTKCSKPTRPNRPIVYRAYAEDELLCPVKWVYIWHTGTWMQWSKYLVLWHISKCLLLIFYKILKCPPFLFMYATALVLSVWATCVASLVLFL